MSFLIIYLTEYTVSLVADTTRTERKVDFYIKSCIMATYCYAPNEFLVIPGA